MSKVPQQTEKHYHGTIPVLFGWGPMYGIAKILVDGDIAWEGPLLRSASTNPVILPLPGGSMRFYWGTATQDAAPVLNGYVKHPPYKRICYGVLLDYDFGQSPNTPNIEIIPMAAPEQSIVTGDSAAEDLDDGFACNPIVLAAEILTAPWWLGLDASLLDAASFQTVADDVQDEIPAGAPSGRSAHAIAQLYNDAVEIRKVLTELLASCDAWLRINNEGKVECGRWRRDGAPPSVTTLTHDDEGEWGELQLVDADTRPNSFTVEFTDSAALYKEASLIRDDDAGIVEADGILRRQTLAARFLTTADQAIRAGEEAVRRSLQRGTWSGEVRIGKAVTPAGDQLQPGDYVIVPNNSPQATAATALVRLNRVTLPKDATSLVAMSGEIDPLAATVPTQVTVTAPADEAGSIMPPILWSRILAIPAEVSGDVPPVIALAARPHGIAIGANVHYDDDTGGDFPRVGRQTSFALPVSLQAAITGTSATVRVGLLPPDANGATPQRDRTLLTDWAGTATEGRNDELLLILLRKTSSTVDYQAGDLLEWVEIMSINGAPTLVSDDVYDLPVLRGRRNTSALVFNDSVTFPDDWDRFEGWIVSRFSLSLLAHADFESMLDTGDPGYFRLLAYSRNSTYDPADAYAEDGRRISNDLQELEYAGQPDGTTYTPEATLVIPPGLNAKPQITVTTPSSFPAAADAGTGDLAVDMDFDDLQGDLVRVQVYSSKDDGTGYQSHLDISPPPTSAYNYAATLNFPTTASSYVLSIVATDAAGNVSRLDLSVTRA